MPGRPSVQAPTGPCMPWRPAPLWGCSKPTIPSLGKGGATGDSLLKVMFSGKDEDR